MLYSPCIPHTCPMHAPRMHVFCQLCVAHRVWRRLLRQQLRAWHCKWSNKQKPTLLRALLSHPFPQFLYFWLDSSYSRGRSHGDGNFGASWPKQQIYDDVTHAITSPHLSSHYMAERGHWTETKKTPESWVLGNESPACWPVMLVTRVMIPSIVLCLAKGYRWGQSEEIHP